MSKATPNTQTAYPLIEPGKRASIAGRTGSGKSSLGCFLLARSPGHWAILNPKGTKAYDNLPDCNTIHGFNLKKIEASMREHKFTNIIPGIHQSSPANLDNFIMWLHSNYENMGLCIDELYTVHTAAGQSGDGLTALLTRGRELKQSYLGMTQRPAWISKFVFSEADYVCEMSLAILKDRKVMQEMMGDNIACLEKLPPYQWLWYDQSRDHLRKLGRVPLLKKQTK